VDQYVEGVLSGDRMVIGRAITLVESNSPAHLWEAQEMLGRLPAHTEKSIRVGITGYPGAGKSTFIEVMGNHLCDLGHRVAVLAVDPSSSISRGSILGDKTRMPKLSQRKNAFIRPSPSGGLLGGVARKSRETMLVCEAAGYDVVLVETVGVGQSETLVRSMADFFLLIMIAGAGDELQGIKRGIMELTDAVCINKADGDNKPRALSAQAEFNRVLHYLQPATEGWETKAYACSSLTGEGIPELWEVIQNFKANTMTSGVFQNRRRSQTVEWIHTLVDEQLRHNFWNHPKVRQAAPELEKAVAAGKLPPTLAAERLLHILESPRSGEHNEK
jgi:LAO/AO transport system kinase